MSAEENQLNVQGYNIVTILKRLETATSRLEDLTVLQVHQRSIDAGSKGIEAPPAPAVPQVPQVPAVAAAPAAPAAPVAEEPELAKSTVRFNEFVEDHVKPFVEFSKTVDAVVAEAAGHFYESFKAQGTFLDIASKAQKPLVSDPAFLEAVKPINENIEKIGAIKDANRRSNYFNHLNTLAEGAPVLGWIVSETPISLIPEFKDSAQFWANRILKEYRETDQKQVDWVKKFLSIFDPLKDYVKEFHNKGPKWNPNGAPLSQVLASSKTSGAPAPSAGAPAPSAGAPAPSAGGPAPSAGAPAPSAGGPAPSAGGPPPPPPPPPANLFDDAPAKAPASGMNAVFAELNKGEAITSGLKKVDKSQMTHKNPELRKAAPAVPKKPTPPKKPSSLSSSSSIPVKKPARKELVDGAKWIIENFTKQDLNGEDLIVIEAEMHQSIFVGNSNGITIQIKGKANAVSVSNTSNTGFVVDSLISGFELVKSHKFGLQVLGTVADITMDQCDEASIYLSQESIDKDIQIYSSSTTALNINVPTEDDYAELAAPEQFKHSIKNGKLVSEVLEHVA